MTEQTIPTNSSGYRVALHITPAQGTFAPTPERRHWRVVRAGGEHDGQPIDGNLFTSEQDAIGAARRLDFLELHRRDMPRLLSRHDYEARCAAAGLDAVSDTWLVEQGEHRIGYAVHGYQFPGPDADGRLALHQQIGLRRLAAIRGESPAPAPQPTAAPATLSRFAPTGTTETTREPEDNEHCATCGQDGWWNPGAGMALCGRHWDAY